MANERAFQKLHKQNFTSNHMVEMIAYVPVIISLTFICPAVGREMGQWKERHSNKQREKKTRDEH